MYNGAEEAKKSNFADQLKLLQQNVGNEGATAPQSGSTTGESGI